MFIYYNELYFMKAISDGRSEKGNKQYFNLDPMYSVHVLVILTCKKKTNLVGLDSRIGKLQVKFGLVCNIDVSV